MIETFGDFVREHRKLRGLSQRALAEACTVGVAAVSRWERGVFLPAIETLPPLRAALDCPVDLLLWKWSRSAYARIGGGS